jgi:hypothetical protein
MLAVIPRRRGKSSAGLDCATLLEQALADLETLNRSTEQDFLTIGGKLGEFVAVARQISSEMAALSELISGGHGRHASQVLTSVLDRSRQIETRAADGDRALARVCESTRQIGGVFSGFQDTVAVFRVLGSLTRVETARLGGAGAEFGNLAEEVTTLTTSIESSGQGILDASSTVRENIQSTLAKLVDLRAGELRELPELIAGIMTSLASLEDRHRLAMEASLRQAEEYREVSDAIGDLIAAIQFHDITRQQVEHVAEALRRLGAELKDGRNRFAAPAEARAVLTLQGSQLSNAEQTFASSVGRIERNLESIAERVRTMAEASKMLIGSSTGERDSFFLQMEGRFTAILQLVATCDAAEAETQAGLASLQEAIERMRESVQEIRQVEIRIHRIAINATIRAVQIGDAGNALNVLAEVMHRLTRDTNVATGQVESALDAITGTARCLSEDSGWTAATESSSTDNTSREMGTTISELHASSESSFSRLKQIAALSARLGDDIQSVRAGFSAGATFASAIGSALATLDQIAGLAGLAHLEIHATAQRHLEDLAKHYTMQSERDVHQSVITGAAARPSAVAPVLVPGQEDLGENVELF